MTNKEILHANLLDIIFENRNKEYGAYALRNDYDRRLLKALGIGLGLVLLLILINFLRMANANPSGNDNDKPSISICNVDLTPKEIIVQEKHKPIEKPKVRQVDYQAPVIVEDIKVKDPLPTNEDVTNAKVSDKNVLGGVDDKSGPADLTNTGSGTLPEVEPVVVKPTFKIREQAPEYPGGVNALVEFMRRNLITPDQLELGDKKIVKVKFVVGKDGSITDITILESPGKEYEKEVSRVVKKMPRWKPGIQNDITVAVAYVLPITFIAVEE